MKWSRLADGTYQCDQCGTGPFSVLEPRCICTPEPEQEEQGRQEIPELWSLDDYRLEFQSLYAKARELMDQHEAAAPESKEQKALASRSKIVEITKKVLTAGYYAAKDRELIQEREHWENLRDELYGQGRAVVRDN